MRAVPSTDCCKSRTASQLSGGARILLAMLMAAPGWAGPPAPGPNVEPAHTWARLLRPGRRANGSPGEVNGPESFDFCFPNLVRVWSKWSEL